MLANRRKTRASAGKHLVDVTLVADVKQESVLRGVEDTVEGNRQFDDTEVWTEMTSCLGECPDQLVTNFLSESRELGFGDFFQIGGGIDPVEEAGWNAHASWKDSSTGFPRASRPMISIRLSAASRRSRQIRSNVIPSS